MCIGDTAAVHPTTSDLIPCKSQIVQYPILCVAHVYRLCEH